jgi:hypothetical protein
MSAKQRSYEKVEGSSHDVYMDKAAAFFRAMNAAYKDENWYSVGLEAVHCAISATDAVLAKKYGIRSTSKDHRDVIKLLEEKLGRTAGAETAALGRIIAMKNQVEYLDRIFTKKEAEEIYKRTDRYFNWAKKMMG